MCARWFAVDTIPTMRIFSNTQTDWPPVLAGIAGAAIAAATFLLWGATISAWFGNFLAGLLEYAPM